MNKLPYYNMSSFCSHNKNKGFTLLEVLVAVTLTALVLGNLFALQSQSKRLSFKAQQSLTKTINQRAYLNAAWLNNRDLDSYLDDLSDFNYSITNEQEITKPSDQVEPLKYSLESFDIRNENQQVIMHSVRIKESIVSRQ